MNYLKILLTASILLFSVSQIDAQTRSKTIHKFSIAYNIKQHTDLNTRLSSYTFTFRSVAYDKIDVFRTIEFDSKESALAFFTEMKDFFDKYKNEKDIRISSKIEPKATFMTDRKYGIKGLRLFYEGEHFLFANKELKSFIQKVAESK